MLYKNFGVTRHGRVVFYDYDEIEYFTDCNVRRVPEPRNEEEEMSGEIWYTVRPHDIFRRRSGPSCSATHACARHSCATMKIYSTLPCGRAIKTGCWPDMFMTSLPIPSQNASSTAMARQHTAPPLPPLQGESHE